MTSTLTRAVLLATGLAALAVALPSASDTARAQDDDSAMVRLIQLLIQKGVLTPDQATSLMRQAKDEAHAAHAASKVARAKAPTATAAAAEPPAPVLPKGTVRVTYVPQAVRDQIAAQVRDQVLGEEKAQGWAAPNQTPEWTRRITVYGDLRLRGQEDLMNKANDNQLTNFNAINTGSPYDTLGDAAPPVLNTQENRTLFRLRARLGVKATIDDWISTDIRLATGNDTSPVSENQTLGQGSNFGKYAIWLDRAYVTLQVPPRALDPGTSVQAFVGRMPNPFWTTNLLYADDLNFDGAALALAAPVGGGVTLWGTGGAFVAYNTTFNYGIDSTFTTDGTGLPSRDKYLFAGQVGADYKPTPDILTKAAVGLFYYQNIQGEESALCTISLSSDVCSTDNSVPQFAQFGNSYFPIRNINQTTGLNQNGYITDPQYYGLASGFNVLDLHGRVDYTKYDPVDVQLEGEFVKNLAFNEGKVAAKGPVNNLQPNTNAYAGGDTGWMVKTVIGKPEIVRLNEWNFVIGYKYLESDAVVDGFTDSDFHLGGTNAKGYFVGGGYGLGHNTYVNARWLSADEVSGPTYRNDVVQVDLNTKF
jgi:hypothetical protein